MVLVIVLAAKGKGRTFLSRRFKNEYG